MAFFGDANECVGFQGAKVVTKFLARNLEASGEHGSRGGLGEFREDTRANRVEGHSSGSGIVDDFDGKHVVKRLEH
jgi:hypothetical protein